MPYRNDDFDRLHPREYPEPDGDDDELAPCPHCRAMIFEESEQCPRCGMYLSQEDEPGSKPWWLVLGLLVCLAVALMWALG